MNLFLHRVLLMFVVTSVDFSHVESFAQSESKSTTLPEEHEDTISKLEATDHKLANVSLPVWTVLKDGILHQMEHVMEMISPFDMYQDPVTSAAAVMFQIRLDSVTTNEITPILRYDDENQLGDYEEEQNTDYFATRWSRRSKSSLSMETPSNTESDTTTVHKNLTTIDDNPSDGAGATNKIRRAIQNLVYIETLVFVNYDLASELKTGPNEYLSIVIHVLTLFNNVDVLFAKVKDPIIKMNLAGIIIGDSIDAFPLYIGGKCHEYMKNLDGKLENGIDAHCANAFLRNFCHEHEEIIPPGTYDIAVLLTRYGLIQHEIKSNIGDRKTGRVKGLAESPGDDYYELMKMGVMPTLVATVSDKGEYESFSILAHEIAYLIGVAHDESIDEMHKQMQPNEKHSLNSLSWSSTSLKSMKKFFGSRDSCIFKNEPGSLQTHGPHKIWDIDQQCQCYGYKSARLGISNELPGHIGINCDKKIECNHENEIVVEGPILMDGTPCGDKKVCWARKCVDITT